MRYLLLEGSHSGLVHSLGERADVSLVGSNPILSDFFIVRLLSFFLSLMRKSNIHTLKKAHQTVYFLDLLNRTTVAILLQLPSNSQESLLKLTMHLKKLGFFLSTSLVKNPETPNIFKCMIVVASYTSKTYSDIQMCIKHIQLLYPTVVLFFIKYKSQFVPVDYIHTLIQFEYMSSHTFSIDSLFSSFSASVLLPQQFTYDLLFWLSCKDTNISNSL